MTLILTKATINEQIDLAELQEQEEIRQELADLKDSDEEDMYPGLKKAESPQIGIKRDRDPTEA